VDAAGKSEAIGMRLIGYVLVPLLIGLGAAQESDLFQAQVLPVLQKECAGCHGDGQVMSGLDLRTRDAMLKGGTRGPALVPGRASQSLLYHVIVGAGPLQMPPGDATKRLPATTIEAFRRWIDAGAAWSHADSLQRWGDYKEADLWAFRPLLNQFRHNSVDAFLNAGLASQNLAPAPRADRHTLIRRVTVDLTGLPPTPEEVEAFRADRSPHAWAKLVDRLLASSRYGERWGRHWLDVVRYADSSGYSNDFERPNAWRYRDYVIRAINTDKPYDEFIREQIAGDELYPNEPEALIATGFLRAGPWEHTGMSVEAVTRQMFLDDVTNAVGVTFLGLTLGCARCHDHKFDPIQTKDYYRLQAAFASTEFARPHLPFLPEEATGDLAAGLAHMREIVKRTQAGLDSFDDRVKAHLVKKHGFNGTGDIPKEMLQKALRDKEGIGPEDFEVLKLYQKHMQLYRDSLDRFEPKAFAVSSGPRDGFTDGGPNLRYPKLANYKSPPVHVLPGGNIQSPAEAVTPGVPSLVERYAGLKTPDLPDTVAGRRAALALWIAHPGNPLTPRVMVNRIWQYHFGRGIAADPSNFGKMGAKPTHPELLDWLARRFISSGWSVKSIHRLILLSDGYQRASEHPAPGMVREKDPGNELLSHFSPRRVEAEVLRDSILAVSGELSSDAGGPGTFPQINESVARQPLHRMGSVSPAYHPSARKRQRNRRTVYTFQQRSLVDPMIEVFNGPSLDLSCERRDSTTIPTQSFTLFNGQFANDMALAFAVRLEKEAPTVEGRLRRAFDLAYGRAPAPEEIRLARAHLARMERHHRSTPPPPKAQPQPIVHTITSELTGQTVRFVQQDDPSPYEANLHAADAGPATRALADFALVLFNSNEFVYVY
jgi:hypothetical protein